MVRGFPKSHSSMTATSDNVGNQVRQDLIVDEGWKNEMYFCTAGKATIGVGHNLANPIPDEAITVILEADIEKAYRDARDAIGYENILNRPIFNTLPDNVQRVLVNMAFQLGGRGLAGFKNMIAAIKDKDYKKAAAEMLDSKWAKQDSPKRAQRLATLMSGEGK